MSVKSRGHVLIALLFVFGTLLTPKSQAFSLTEVSPKYMRLTLVSDKSNEASILFHLNQLDQYELQLMLRKEGQSTPTRKYYHSITDYKDMNNVLYRLKGLELGVKYYFYVKNIRGKSKTYSFRLPAPGEKLSIISGGDSRSNRDIRQKANKLAGGLSPDLIMFDGDMTSYGTGKQWKQWLEDWQLTVYDNHLIPIVPARGNHEFSNKDLEVLFDTPRGVYYKTSIANGFIDIFTLNSEVSITGKQTSWLAKALKGSKSMWKFAQYHKPMIPHVRKKKLGLAQQKNWAPLFYKHQVQLVVEGDSHVTKITHPIRPSSSHSSGFVRDDKRGTMYIGEGCWGAPLRSNDNNQAWTLGSGSFNQFKRVIVSHDQLKVETININESSLMAPLAHRDRFATPTQMSIWKPVVRTISLDEIARN